MKFVRALLCDLVGCACFHELTFNWLHWVFTHCVFAGIHTFPYPGGPLQPVYAPHGEAHSGCKQGEVPTTCYIQVA